MTEFCPNCFTRIAAGHTICPACGTDVAYWSRPLRYEDRLIRALHHPLADVRMRAIIALVKAKHTAAATALCDRAFAHGADVPGSGNRTQLSPFTGGHQPPVGTRKNCGLPSRPRGPRCGPGRITRRTAPSVLR